MSYLQEPIAFGIMLFIAYAIMGYLFYQEYRNNK